MIRSPGEQCWSVAGAICLGCVLFPREALRSCNGTRTVTPPSRHGFVPNPHLSGAHFFCKASRVVQQLFGFNRCVQTNNDARFVCTSSSGCLWPNGFHTEHIHIGNAGPHGFVFVVVRVSVVRFASGSDDVMLAAAIGSIVRCRGRACPLPPRTRLVPAAPFADFVYLARASVPFPIPDPAAHSKGCWRGLLMPRSHGQDVAHALTTWPCGLMDKALAFGTKDCRFESCQGHLRVLYRFDEVHCKLLAPQCRHLWDSNPRGETPSA